MRVKMLESLPVTVDGVQTLDLQEGEEYEIGDGVAENLIENGKAELAESHEASPSRGRRRGKAEAKDDGPADENKADEA